MHHRQHWAQRGHRKQSNLLLVCLYHHKVLHEGGWNVQGDPNDAVTFVNPDGRPMAEGPLPPPRTDPGAIGRAHAGSGTHIRADTITSKWDAGEDLDVTALWYLDPPEPN